MIKTTTILLVLLMMLSLVACGGGQTAPEPTAAATEVPATPEPTPKSLESILISTSWKAVLDYSLTSEREFYFDSDGSGSMIGSEGYGQDFNWSGNEDSFRVKFTSPYTNNTVYYQFSYNRDTNRLVDADNNIILVPKDNFENELTSIKKEISEKAAVLNWSEAHKLYVSNEAQFIQRYAGKYFKWTAVVDSIGSNYCDMSELGLRINSIIVYMSQSELATIKTGDTITVIGWLDRYGSKLNGAFLSK